MSLDLCGLIQGTGALLYLGYSAKRCRIWMLMLWRRSSRKRRCMVRCWVVVRIKLRGLMTLQWLSGSLLGTL